MEYLYAFLGLLIFGQIVLFFQTKNHARNVLKRWGSLPNEYPPAFALDINPYVRGFLFIPETRPVFVRFGLNDEGLCLYKIGSVSVILYWQDLECRDYYHHGDKKYTEVRRKINGELLFRTTPKVLEAMKEHDMGCG